MIKDAEKDVLMATKTLPYSTLLPDVLHHQAIYVPSKFELEFIFQRAEALEQL